jgi:hypothetical protein
MVVDVCSSVWSGVRRCFTAAFVSRSGLECGVFTPLLFGLFLSGVRQSKTLPRSGDKAEKQERRENAAPQT